MATSFPSDWNNLIDAMETNTKLFNTFVDHRSDDLGSAC